MSVLRSFMGSMLFPVTLMPRNRAIQVLMSLGPFTGTLRPPGLAGSATPRADRDAVFLARPGPRAIPFANPRAPLLPRFLAATSVQPLDADRRCLELGGAGLGVGGVDGKKIGRDVVLEVQGHEGEAGAQSVIGAHRRLDPAAA